MNPRLLIYGAGAVGSFLGGRLAQAGLDVTLAARGAHLTCLQEQGGVQVHTDDGRVELQGVRAALPSTLLAHAFDLIVVTLKTTQLLAAAQDIRRLLAPGGCLVMVQNGLPWWLFEGVDSPWAGTPLKSLESGELQHAFDLKDILGAVIYRPATLLRPGHVFLPKVNSPHKLVLGEIDHTLSERLKATAHILERGYPVECTANIRAEKWRKLLFNVVWGPLSALTQSSSGHLVEIPTIHDLIAAVFRETVAIAQCTGTQLHVDAQQEIQRVMGNYLQQPSMLQDVRSGRPLEWKSIIGAVVEIAELAHISAPHLRTLAALIEGLDATLQRAARQ